MKSTYLFNPLLITNDFGKSLVNSNNNAFPKFKWIPFFISLCFMSIESTKKVRFILREK